MAADVAGGMVGSTMTAAKPYVTDEPPKPNLEVESAAPTIPSHHRAIYGLRKGHLHKALGVGESEALTSDHIARGKASTNPHVKAMADLAE